jgi:hypothetical protein
MTNFCNMLKQKLKVKGVDLSKASADKLKAGWETVAEKFLTALMLSRANSMRYNGLK